MQAIGGSWKMCDQEMLAGFEIVIAYGINKACQCRAMQTSLSQG